MSSTSSLPCLCEKRSSDCLTGERGNNNINKVMDSQNQNRVSVLPINVHPLSTPSELDYPRTLILGLWRVLNKMSNPLSLERKESRDSIKIPRIGKQSCLIVKSDDDDYDDPLSSSSSNTLSSSGRVINTLNIVRNCPSDQSNFKSSLPTLSSSCCTKKSRLGSWTFLLVIFYLLVLTPSIMGCGPGRGAGRRRAPRKLTPLVYKQHVPNVPENTLSASGLTEGKITRDHQRFKNLVPNYNQDIIFRDDEGSGADRLMTQRCKEKLNTLAISVMNQWPGVKLRVIEGWDEENLHAPHSLHYEGRAVDITTSDKDRSKYGMLARLAVEAGFDWVYYESRAHIHCSVKSDSTQTGRTGGCFNGNSTVETPTGSKRMFEIKPGDQILSLDSNGEEIYSDVLMFLDRNISETREFYELQTGSGSSIILTPSHLIYTVQPESLTPDEKFLFNPNNYILPNQTGQLFLDKAVISFAKNVQIGDWVLVKRNESRIFSENILKESGQETQTMYDIEKIIGMEVRIETGVYAPLTTTGNLIVDGVLASCYAVIDDQDLAHIAFLPVRLSHNFFKGISYLWRQFSRFITFRSHHPNEVVVTMAIPMRTTTPPPPPSNDNSRSSSPIIKISIDDQGVHWYADYLYSISRYILPSNLQYDN